MLFSGFLSHSSFEITNEFTGHAANYGRQNNYTCHGRCKLFIKYKREMKTKVTLQSDLKKKFKERAKKATAKLPFGWINSFVAKFPEYKELKVYVTNVSRGMSYDEAVTVKLEELANLLKPIKK